MYRDLVNTSAFFALLTSVHGRRCLDIGCGEGHNTRLLAERAAQVVALDIVDTFIEAAESSDGGRRIRCLLGDGAQLPFRSSCFDAVTAFMSLMDGAESGRALPARPRSQTVITERRDYRASTSPS